MASISTDSKGLRRILFVGADGKRKPIRLGRVPIKTARTIKTHVEALAAAVLLRGLGPPCGSSISLSTHRSSASVCAATRRGSWWPPRAPTQPVGGQCRAGGSRRITVRSAYSAPDAIRQTRGGEGGSLLELQAGRGDDQLGACCQTMEP